MSKTQSQLFSVSVGQFGHPLLKGARHWSILIENTPQPTSWTYDAVLYQVSGSTYTYEYAKPLSLNLREDPTFMGNVHAGYLSGDQRDQVDAILSEVPVVHGDLGWNCQNWVVTGLQALANAGFDVKTYSQPEMLDMFRNAKT